jgi:hypothetical protein
MQSLSNDKDKGTGYSAGLKEMHWSTVDFHTLLERKEGIYILFVSGKI